jgi:hypothetical protein
MVQACEQCNRSKNDQLAVKQHLDRLQARNKSEVFLNSFGFEKKQAADKNRILEIYFNDCALYFDKNWEVSN